MSTPFRLPDQPRPLPLDRVAWPDGLSVVVLGPHPDDFDCVAATLRLLHRHGARIAVAVLSTGVSGVDDADAAPPTAARKAELRRAEQIESVRRFGLPAGALHFLPLDEDEDGEPANQEANRERIADFLVAHAPDLVFLPHGHDQKGGHRNVYALFRAAVEARGLMLCALLNRDPKTIAIRTDVFMPYDEETSAWKADLLRCHATQQQRNLRSRGRGFDARILDMDRDSARRVSPGHPFAEAFELEWHPACAADPSWAHLRSVKALGSIYQTAPIGLCVLDRDLRYVRINDFLAKMNGLPAAAHIGRTVREIVPLVADAVEEIATRIFAHGLPEFVTERPGFDTSAPEREGVWRASWYPIKGAAGEVIGLNLMVEDITATRRAEADLRHALGAMEAKMAEQTTELAASERKYRALAENTRDIPFALDGGGIVRYVGPQIAAYGFDPERMIGTHFLEHVYPEDRERAMARFQESLLHDDGSSLEVRLATPRGPVWFEERDRVQAGADGQVSTLTGVLREITSSKETADALRESEEKYRKLFDTEADSIVMLDAETNRPLDANDAALRMYGYTRDEFMKLTTADVTAEPDTSLRFLGQIRAAGTGSAELRWHRRKDGSRFPIEIHASAFSWRGRTVLCLVLRDISAQLASAEAQRKAVAALRESEEKYRKLFELETDGVIFIDMAKRGVIDVNDAALRLYGYTRDEFMNVDVRVITAEPEATEGVATQLREHGTAHVPVRWHRRKDGTLFPVEVNAVLFNLDGNSVTFLVVRHVAEQLAWEDESRRQREALSRLAGEVATAAEQERRRIAMDLHDNLVQLLVSCQVRLDHLVQQPRPRNLKTTLRRVLEILDRSVKGTRDLTFRLAPPVLYEIGLAAALEQLCREMTEEYGLPFIFRQVHPSVPVEAGLRQVLFRCTRELAVNAGRHAAARQVVVTLDQVGDRLLIVVEDDGKGFDSSRAGMEFSAAGGFGLFSARQQLIHVGAILEISSTPGQGTKVLIDAPMRRAIG